MTTVLVWGWNGFFGDSRVTWVSCSIFSFSLISDELLLSLPSALTVLNVGPYRVISKVVSAPEAKPSTPAARPKTPPPVPSPVPAPVHVTPPPAPAPPPPQATISPVLIPPPSPAVSAAGGSKAPVRSVVTETVSTYVVGNTCHALSQRQGHSSLELVSSWLDHHLKLMAPEFLMLLSVKLLFIQPLFPHTFWGVNNLIETLQLRLNFSLVPSSKFKFLLTSPTISLVIFSANWARALIFGSGGFL